ncbi:MAG: N-acetylmuramoyl-L-alanine amidase [Rhizomicrobium sp.]
MRVIERPSPNQDSRGPGVKPDLLVLHYTGMRTAAEALARLCDTAAKVSAHYTVDEDGTIYAHVPEDRRAWHAGVSFWAGVSNINGCSLGIELVNPGHEFGYRPFADAQIEALIDLIADIRMRHPIARHRIVGHSDVAPARKQDPGELFPWKQLADYGIGLWPETAARHLRGTVTEGLARFGYGTPPLVDWPLENTIAAFQRRFRPAQVTGLWDHECGRLLESLLTFAGLDASNMTGEED